LVRYDLLVNEVVGPKAKHSCDDEDGREYDASCGQ
jgi:hypothetical protein